MDSKIKLNFKEKSFQRFADNLQGYQKLVHTKFNLAKTNLRVK